MKTGDVVYRQDLYVRFKPDPAVIQEYSENLDVLPPIEVDQHGILIDGYHRWKAYQTAGVDEIPSTVTKVGSETELQMLAVVRNAKHGLQLTPDEKKAYAIRWWEVLPEAEIEAALSISHNRFLAWTADKRRQKEDQQRKRVVELWMACRTQQAIADEVGVLQRSVANWIADFSKTNAGDDLANFGNFEPQLYALWNFGGADAKVRHFGNLPTGIIDNLLWYYTKPFDVVFDPFGGSGSTIDKCIERSRRYYVSDLSPIPARSDIREHDITTGLPEDLPVPDLVFLDPPYWRQAKGKYSKKPSDLSNMQLAQFLDVIAEIARAVKRKWSKGRTDRKPHIALIMGPWKERGEYIDLPFLCYERLAKHLCLKQRVAVPYSTQVHGGNYIKRARDQREILYLIRDLMIFGP